MSTLEQALPVLPLPPWDPPPPLAPVEVDERAARRSLRAQIARQEAELARLLAGDEHPRPLLAAPRPSTGDARLLSLGALERTRDDLSRRVHDVRAELVDMARRHEHARRRLEAMLLDPAAHRFARVSRDELGERGCGGWEVRPRLGLIGMLAGWWQVVVSSGCPLAMAYHRRRQYRPWGRNARLEIALTVLVMAVVVAVAILFLFVYHDVPLRTS